MTEDVEFALNRLSEALADGDPSWIEDAVQEVAIAMDEQRDELLWAVARVTEARQDGDREWIADTVEELQNVMLSHGAYTEVCRIPIGATEEDEDNASPEQEDGHFDDDHNQEHPDDQYPSNVPPWLRNAEVWR